MHAGKDTLGSITCASSETNLENVKIELHTFSSGPLNVAIFIEQREFRDGQSQ
jgi:hypothetical protein